MFSCDEDATTKWILELFPYGDTKSDAVVSNSSEGHMSFFVKLDKSSSTDISNLHARYFIYILGIKHTSFFLNEIPIVTN